MKKCILWKRTYGNNKSKIDSVVLEKCSEALKAKLDGQQDWNTIHNDHDLVNLMKSIKARMLNQPEDRKTVLSTYPAISTLFRLRQCRHENLAGYWKRFVATLNVVGHIGVVLWGGLVKISDNITQEDLNKTKGNTSDGETNNAETREGNRLVAIAFIKSADETRYGEIITDLKIHCSKATINTHPT